jgi:predicted hydrocarbon binding protein
VTQSPAHLPEATLRLSLEATVGHELAARALQRAGHDAGDAIFDAIRAEVGENGPANLDEADFWQRLNAFCADRGWGNIIFEEMHPGLGALESADWAEADPGVAALRPSCHFTVGMIANLLGRIANDDVGVLETECRSRGDLYCRFIFGGRAALDQVYAGIRAGVAVDDLIADLD